MNKTVVIGISSGIAAYKIVDLVRILKTKKITVEIVMTTTAVKMFGVEMFEKAAGKKVYTDLIPNDFDYRQVLKKREVEHIKLADGASLIVIAPATANIIGKIAAGIADDFLTTTILATEAPVLICPSMNIHMWNNPVLKENLDKIRSLGYQILSPGEGGLACGYDGIGRLPEPEIIAKEVFYLLEKKSRLKGRKIIVTAGGTSESIDAVRVITNRASGKMGVALAEECFSQGAEVLLLMPTPAIHHIKLSWREKDEDTSEVARSDSSDGGGIKGKTRLIEIGIFETAEDLERLIRKYINNYDILFHTAAVSDFIPEKKLDTKLDSGKSFLLKLKPATKILHKIKSWNPKIKLIGFKAVYKEKEEALIQIGLQKLKDSNSDFIIVNDVGKEGIGFGVDTNEVYIVSPKGLVAKIDKASKKEIARKILDYIFE